MTTKTVQVPKDKHKYIIGKGGSTIKEIQTTYGVVITIPQGESDTVTVTGDKVDAAIAAINERTGGTDSKSKKSSSSAPSKASSSDNAATKTLEIPEEDHKYIVGPGGANIKSIREETKCDIKITTKPDQVVISGPDDKAVKAAEKLVKKSIAKVHDQHEATEGWYQKYQKAIDDHAKKRAEYFEQAKKAHDAGNGALAKELSEKGKKETELMEKAQEKAARAVFEKRNKDNGSDTIDLHGLQVEGALMLATEWFEKTHKKTKGKEVNIITGKGNHSDANGPKILPAIEKLLTDRKLKFEAVPGGFKINL